MKGHDLESSRSATGKKRSSTMAWGLIIRNRGKTPTVPYLITTLRSPEGYTRNESFIQASETDKHGFSDLLSHSCAVEENWLLYCKNTAPSKKEPVYQNGKLGLDMSAKRSPCPKKQTVVVQHVASHFTNFLSQLTVCWRHITQRRYVNINVYTVPTIINQLFAPSLNLQLYFLNDKKKSEKDQQISLFHRAF